MHGLINLTLQCFLKDTYGNGVWSEIAERARLEIPEFEAMLTYDPQILKDVLTAAEATLVKPRDATLEDLGTYLVCHPNNESLRRLLRFGGVDFVDFMHSLDDLPDRVRLAVEDLELPELELREMTQENYCLEVRGTFRGFGHVVVGLLRAMADDYGALVLLDHRGQHGDTETIDIALVETEFAEGREFQLGADPTLRRSAVQ
ncbi:heme NO-binding domain-containing protein [Aestuariicoccus sp. MJ-SS9]|uniref:heme NO-binding domain-containing protein n=1 Tax=Aestuariicoccus sp. MJ-SS9 TaxID=3079855 RepID=UPI0029075134|nr:heme NO-binding domain-containing protein [Aestuariicoccus sp. MJ-SS9]MDU8909975.1 heme NO-binding domain-containing protein [Aestuariicoccus sp. MJ-SS9]